ncbi:GNAT family N-acetyltransferase [Sphingomonas sp. VNH70]|jgi:ribosomal protein S18 acetylase RimI-like enzyme
MDRRMLVLERDGRIDAYTSWSSGGIFGRYHINKLVVRPEARGQGIARALVGSLGVALSGRVFISTPSDDVAALALLRSTGWTPAGELTGMGAGHDVEAFFYRDLDTGERPAG